jgi:hypothetical protein
MKSPTETTTEGNLLAGQLPDFPFGKRTPKALVGEDHPRRRDVGGSIPPGGERRSLSSQQAQHLERSGRSVIWF